MIDFYYWPTPNGWKVSIMLEETGLPYTLKPVNIGAGDQFKPEFHGDQPECPHAGDRRPRHARRPAAGFRVRCHPAPSGGEVRPVHADDRDGRKECLEWLFWQVGNLGPMAGQLSHFVNYAKSVEETDHSYAHKRYAGEYNRCLGRAGAAAGGAGVHSRRLFHCRYDLLAMGADRQAAGPGPGGVSQCLALAGAIKSRPAVQRGVDLGKELRRTGQHTEESRKILFGQSARSLRG